MDKYTVLIHPDAFQKVETYFNELRANKIRPGFYLNQKLDNKDISGMSATTFLELIMQTKKPQIFAESDVCGDGLDWNQQELSILGDVSIAVPVTVYDNGLHFQPSVHKLPFEATLLYTPGALLRNGRNNQPADWGEVIKDNELIENNYRALYERRLLPIFRYAHDQAGSRKKKAFITIPGLGCGQFAGKFRGQLGTILKQALMDLLTKHGETFSNIQGVYYDPYQECNNERHEIKGISFFVRPLTQGNENKPQLCKPVTYQESGDDFTACELFSVVAWDHVSWPGNDFYAGMRSTDDGVKAAATNSMAVMTGVEGNYFIPTNTYKPSKEYRNWEMVVLENKINLDVVDRLLVLP